jgi:hypothetical protein
MYGTDISSKRLHGISQYITAITFSMPAAFISTPQSTVLRNYQKSASPVVGAETYLPLLHKGDASFQLSIFLA